MTRRDRKSHEERLARYAVAAEWMQTLKSADLRDHAAFDEWLRESKLNVEGYLELEALDQQVRALDASARPDIEAIAASLSARVPTLNERIAERRSDRTVQRTRWAWIGLAAGIVLAVSLALLDLQWPRPSTSEVARTAPDAQRTLALEDGSVVRMNGDTQLRIDYTADQRTVHLFSGEAIFDVARQAHRPFIVQTPTASVRALGTQFNVYQRQSTVVSVIEGRVQLTLAHASGTARLEAGEQAEIAQGEIVRPAKPDVAQAIAWRNSQPYFDNASLEDIVSEYNHSSAVKIILEDVPRGAYHFSGTFNVEEPDSLADILEAQTGLKVERREKQIIVRRRD